MFCALSWEDGSPPETFAAAHERLSRTSDFWHEWISRGKFPDHPWRAYLQRSALTLKGLIYAPTGALLAASTTSLPETPGGERNYDYRYSWLRDSTFMLWGLSTLGFDREANDFFYFLSDLAEDEADLQIMYGIGGERELTEHTLDHLSGYEGARPVRIGNGAWDQRQHDVWGVLLDSVYLHTRTREASRRATLADARAAGRSGAGPLAGTGPGHLGGAGTAPALHRLQGAVLGGSRPGGHAGGIAGRRGAMPKQWRQAANEIHDNICAHGTDEQRGVLPALRDDRPGRLRSCSYRWSDSCLPTTPVVRATVLAIANELTEDELVLRYRVEETEDGFSGEEGTFTICSFWLVSALVEIGEVERARALCAKLLAFASRPCCSTRKRSTRIAAGTSATSPKRSPIWP